MLHENIVAKFRIIIMPEKNKGKKKTRERKDKEAKQILIPPS